MRISDWSSDVCSSDLITLQTPEGAVAFLEKHRRIVVKPARGEQGRGVFVDLRRRSEVLVAYETARRLGAQVIAEEFITGEDLRIIVIDGGVGAAATRRQATIVGDGTPTVRSEVRSVGEEGVKTSK